MDWIVGGLVVLAVAGFAAYKILGKKKSKELIDDAVDDVREKVRDIREG